MKKLVVFFAAFCALCFSLGAQVFYEGQGGKNLGGIRVSDIVPSGLSRDEAELLPLIQLTLSNDFSKYAGMMVPALEDTAFSTRYTLTGTISKTGGAYRLTFVIKDNSSGAQKTSYGPMQCTLQELQTLKGIKAASEELITGMGVALTQAGKNALRTTATNEAEAQNLIAKGVVAVRNGEAIAAQMLFYQAVEIDPSQMEAANRASITAANISTGNIGNDRRNDIQWRKNWITTLTDTEKYFDNFFKTFNQPYALVYTPELQYGNTDYRTETLPVSFTVELRERSNWTDPILKTVLNVQKELNATGRKKAWELNWPRSRVSNVDPLSSGYKRLEIAVELVNAKNKVIGQKTFTVRGDWNFSFDYNTGDLKSITTSVSPSKESPNRVTFDKVNANDITDNLTLRFVSVNSVPVAQASKTGLLMIAPQSEYYDAAGFNDWGYDRDGYNRDGYNREGWTKDGYDRYGYDKDGYNRNGYDKYGFNREGWTKDGYGRDGYGRDGYDWLGFDRDGINRAGYDKKNYLVDNSNRTGYDSEGYNTAGYDRGGYNKAGFNRNGYNRDGYNKDGFNRNGRNRLGQTRQDVEKAAKKAEWQARVQESWGGGYFGFFIGGAGNIQPAGGLFEFGLEGGGKWFSVDFGLSWGGGLQINDELVEEKLGSILGWEDPVVFTPRIGVAFPLNFPKARLNIGGGIEFLNIYVDEYRGKEEDGAEGNKKVGKVDIKVYQSQMLDTLFTPYVGAKLDIPFTRRSGLLGFIGYRAEFTPVDKVETYFGEPSSLRHTIFAGLEARGRWGY